MFTCNLEKDIIKQPSLSIPIIIINSNNHLSTFRKLPPCYNPQYNHIQSQSNTRHLLPFPQIKSLFRPLHLGSLKIKLPQTPILTTLTFISPSIPPQFKSIIIINAFLNLQLFLLMMSSALSPH